MARFFCDSQGKLELKTPIGYARTGTSESGLSVHARGWNVGILVTLEAVNGHDIIKVYKTGGSHNPLDLKLLTVVEGVGEDD